MTEILEPADVTEPPAEPSEPVDPGQPTTVVPPVEGTAEEEPEAADALIVLKRVDGQGNISTEVILNGKVQPTEVQTLLELAVKGWRKQIGLA